MVSLFEWCSFWSILLRDSEHSDYLNPSFPSSLVTSLFAIYPSEELAPQRGAGV